MRNRTPTLLLALASLLAAVALGAGLLLADDASPAAPQATETVGTLVSINAVTRTLALQADEAVQKFLWDASTVVVENDRKIAAANLDKGDRLKIDWKRDGDLRLASRIEVLPAVEPASSHR